MRFKQIVSFIALSCGCFIGLRAFAVTATASVQTDFVRTFTEDLAANGDIDVTTPTGFQGAGVSFQCDGDDGGGTVTAYASFDNGTSYTAVTDSLGSGVTCTAACVKTVYQAGYGAMPTGFRLTLSGSGGGFDLDCTYVFTRGKA